MDLLKSIEIFIEVAENESFIEGANKLDLSAAVVSRQIAALEKHLGTRLFHRTTRKISLTTAGAEYLNRVKQIFSDLKEAEAILNEQSQSPSGTLRISAPLSFGISKMGTLMAKFIKLYPNIKPQIDLNDKTIDLTNDGIDVALRVGSKLDDNLIARKICQINMAICASPEYLEQYGSPEDLKDLENHKILSYSYLSQNNDWELIKGDNLTIVNTRPIVVSNNGDILRDMAINGAGIILQPLFIVEKALKNKELIELFPDWQLKDFSLYAVFLSRKFMPSKIRVFIDFMVQELSQ